MAHSEKLDQPVETVNEATNGASFHHMEGEEDLKTHHNDQIKGIEIDLQNLPKGYYRSSFFIGSMLAVWFGLMAGVGGFGIAAPILTLINDDIGPDPNYVWVALVYSTTLAIGQPFVGRLSDIFGRRYFFISGAAMALVGAVICGTAQSIPVLIGGEVFIGFGASAQLAFPYAMGELVPLKYRFMGNAFIYTSLLPFSALAPAIANAVALHTSAGWRMGFYLLIICDALSLILFVVFYRPPTFHMKHTNEKIWQLIKQLDYVGAILFTGGILLFLMGLSWGGSVYPWKSAHVIGCIAVGAVTMIAFFSWEALRPLKEPLMPVELFKNRRWVVTWLSLGLGAGQYYALSIVWPQMVNNLYSAGEPLHGAWLSCLVGSGILTGEVIGGGLAKVIGKTKYQLVVVMALALVFLGLAATCTPESKSRAIAFVYLGATFIGYNESLTLSLCTIIIDDQQQIGIATGIASSMRALISAVMSTIYVVVMKNRLTANIGDQVPKALINAGLPSTSVAKWLKALSAGGSFSSVSGATASVNSAGIAAYKSASSSAYQTVFLTTIAFTGLALICNCFVPNVDERMTDGVAATLHKRGKEDLA